MKKKESIDLPPDDPKDWESQLDEVNKDLKALMEASTEIAKNLGELMKQFTELVDAVGLKGKAGKF